MDEKTVQHILTEIIYCVLNEENGNTFLREELEGDALASVYRLAKKHDLAYLLSRFVYHNRIDAEAELQLRLQRDELMSVYRHERMKYAFDEICGVFNEEEIQYIPLKGSVIRQYYPAENLRTSCDIDILIHKEDIDTAVNALTAKGYICGDRHYHDVSLYSPNKTHLELHFSIQENMDTLDYVLKDAWEYAMQIDGSRYEFRKEFFVFHMYAHMAYHFMSGGCGIRSLMDVWIMEHRMDAKYAIAEELLRKAGIFTFAEKISKIANMCFTENKIGIDSENVIDYIFSGGVYGSRKNKAAITKKEIGNSAIYALKRLFLPYSSMTILYPVLKKIPLLIPFCWIHRWFKALFGGKSAEFAAEIAEVNNVSDDCIAKTEQLLSDLGLNL